jgi:hypothetical protein
VVARRGDALLVVPAPRPPDPVRELVALCAGADPAGAPLRALLARWSPQDVPPFALLVRAGSTLRIAVHGGVRVLVDGRAADPAGPGRGVPLVEQAVEDGAWREVTIAADGDAGTTYPVDLLDLDLEAGAVPGSAVTLHPPAATPEPVATRSETALRPALRFRSVLLGECADRAPSPATPARRSPLPVAGGPGRSGASDGEPAGAGPGVLVEGAHCPQGHFTDPDRATCLACDAPLPSERHRVVAPRPPLGVLVTDGGTVYPVTGDLVIGREPDRAPDVLTGRARPVRLSDAERSTSRVHARLTVDGWRVLLVDERSANGTLLSGHGAGGPWLPLPPGTPVPLTRGDRIRLGRRQLLFDTWREDAVVPPVPR